MERKTENMQMVYCPKYSYDMPHQVEHICKDCCFCEKIETDKVHCLYDRRMMLQHMHVTRMESCGKIYTSHNARDYSNEDWKKILESHGLTEKEFEDTCDVCCFNKKLSTNEFFCQLRHSATSDEISAFCCYDDEFWTEEDEPKDESEED